MDEVSSGGTGHPAHTADDSEEAFRRWMTEQIAERLLHVRARLIGEGYTQAIGIELSNIADELARLRAAQSSSIDPANIERIAERIADRLDEVVNRDIQVSIIESELRAACGGEK